MAQETSNVKYLAKFVGADGVQRECQIIDTSGQWETQQITLTALLLDEDNSAEIFKPLRIWSGSVSFFSDGITLEDLMPQTSQSLIVKIVRGDAEEFVGYLQGESLSQTYGQHGEVVSFTVASRLSVGSGLEYQEKLSCSADNILTLGQLLYDCLKQCGAEDTDAIYMCDSVLLTAEADSPWKLFAAVVDRYRFYKENNDKTINEDYTKDDVSTIVAEILRPFGLLMHEQGANFVITHTNISTSTTYRMLFVSQLKDITEANTIGEASTPMTVHFVDTSILYDTEQRADYYRGSKKFRVTLDQGLQEVDVFRTLLDYEQYDLVHVPEEYREGYVRRHWGGDNYVLLKHFGPINKKHNKCRFYPYRLITSSATSTGEEFVAVDDFATWRDNQRPGCTLIRYQSQPPSTRSTFRPKSGNNEEWEDGVIINPSQYQIPELSQTNKSYIYNLPLITVTTEKGYLLYGGRFVLTMTIAHHPYPSNDGEKETNPGDNNFILCDRFSIGNDYYAGYFPKRPLWQNSQINTALHITGGEIGMASLERYFVAPVFDNPNGMFYFHPGTKKLTRTNGNASFFRGKITWSLLLGGKIPLRANNSELSYIPQKTGGVILTGLSLKYSPTPDNERSDKIEGETPRDYYRNSENGFDGDEKRVTTLFGSYAEGGGSALSNMFYNNEPITTIYNGVRDIVIEEALVLQLKKYYDRICEIRTITIKDDATKYYAGDIVAMEDGEFLTLAVSVDYLNGVRKLTVTKIITA